MDYGTSQFPPSRNKTVVISPLNPKENHLNKTSVNMFIYSLDRLCSIFNYRVYGGTTILRYKIGDRGSRCTESKGTQRDPDTIEEIDSMRLVVFYSFTTLYLLLRSKFRWKILNTNSKTKEEYPVVKPLTVFNPHVPRSIMTNKLVII